MVFDHHKRNLQEALTEIQHEYGETICSSMHVHLDDRIYLEAIAVRGEAKKLKELSDKLKSRSGVQYVRPTMLSI